MMWLINLNCLLLMKKLFTRPIWLLPLLLISSMLFSSAANAASFADSVFNHGLSLGALLTTLAVLLIQITHQRSVSSLIIAVAVIVAVALLVIPMPPALAWVAWFAVLAIQSAAHYRLIVDVPSRRVFVALASVVMVICGASELMINTGMNWLAIPLLLSAVVCFGNGWSKYGQVKQDLDQEKIHSERQMVEAGHDVKTGLPNRLKIEHIGDNLIRSGNHKSLSFLLIKMNNFQEINKVLGHSNGDLLLAQAAQRIQNKLKDIDDVMVLEMSEGSSVKVANLGGVDFGILIDSSVKNHLAENIADDFINKLMDPLVLQSCALEFVISAGIANYPEHGTSISALINHSLDAINSYRTGDSKDVVYSPDSEFYTNERISLMSSLRDAINDNTLVLHVQPLVNLKNNEVYGGEVFIRWRHPEKGLIHPEEFIALAEQTGVIFSLTQWILEQVIVQLRVMKEAGLTQKLSVNIGNTDLLQIELIETIELLMLREGIDCSSLILEIKEAALLDNPDKAYEVLQQISQRNIGISIDDFGTGYTSLNYLRKLPIKEVKIDCSFVAGLGNSNTNNAITGAIIDIARKLELDVVAEGVEDESTARKLLEMGCSKAQGYLYSKPFELSGFASWVQQWEKGR